MHAAKFAFPCQGPFGSTKGLPVGSRLAGYFFLSTEILYTGRNKFCTEFYCEIKLMLAYSELRFKALICIL